MAAEGSIIMDEILSGFIPLSRRSSILSLIHLSCAHVAAVAPAGRTLSLLSVNLNARVNEKHLRSRTLRMH